MKTDLEPASEEMMSPNGTAIQIDSDRLLSRINALGNIGRDEEGRLSRVALTDEEKLGRDQCVRWLEEAGLEVMIDRIGNIFGIWRIESNLEPIMFGSHIDSVINAGIYDGCYGVLAGLSVIEAIRESGYTPDRSMIVGAFTNEEGVRYAPDMMGSLVYSGGLNVGEALSTVGTDGTVLGEELKRIGYAGELEPGSIKPSYYIEVHVEQGPVLEAEGKLLGAVNNLQGISWQKISIKGVANHAGTTPTYLRVDAGLAAAKVVTFLRSYVEGSNSVATVGTMKFEPNLVNVVPDFAEFTVDLRDPDAATLNAAEAALNVFLKDLETSGGVSVETERLVRFEPVTFDESLVKLIETSAAARNLSCRRMTSGAGHDAQMMSRMCPTAMIFVPSRDGISHNPREFTEGESLIAGAQVLLDTASKLTGVYLCGC